MPRAGLYTSTSCCIDFYSVAADPLSEGWFSNLPWEEVRVPEDDAELIELEKCPETDGIDELDNDWTVLQAGRPT